MNRSMPMNRRAIFIRPSRDENLWGEESNCHVIARRAALQPGEAISGNASGNE